VEATERHPDYSDPGALALRSWILHARGDRAGAERDSIRAAAQALASDAQAQSQTFCIRAHVALATGNRADAEEFASRLLGIGTVVVPALYSPFPMLTGRRLALPRPRSGDGAPYGPSRRDAAGAAGAAGSGDPFHAAVGATFLLEDPARSGSALRERRG
jgi:hypothetical protein